MKVFSALPFQARYEVTHNILRRSAAFSLADSSRSQRRELRMGIIVSAGFQYFGQLGPFTCDNSELQTGHTR